MRAFGCAGSSPSHALLVLPPDTFPPCCSPLCSPHTSPLQGGQLAIEMYRRLGLHAAAAGALLRAGDVAGALRVVQRQRVGDIPPQQFLEAAAAARDEVCCWLPLTAACCTWGDELAVK